MSLSEAGAEPQGPGVAARAREAFDRVRERGADALKSARERVKSPSPFKGAAHAPRTTVNVPGFGRMELATDRVRARPALSSTLSGALGLNAIGLGVLGTFFPRRVANFLGIHASRGAVVTLFGLRELVSGYALVSDPTRTGALWSRVLFDVFDIAVLKAAADDPFNHKRGNAKGALAVVLTVSALDLIAAVRQSTVKRNCD